jgi:hypothetical protein
VGTTVPRSMLSLKKNFSDTPIEMFELIVTPSVPTLVAHTFR